MDEYVDICRSFSFVNLNIPPCMKDISDQQDLFHCGYISIGFFDEMRTELLTPPQNRSILSSMWLCNERLALALDGTHSFQNIFGFRRVTSKEVDEDFWSPKTDYDYPLTFVTFLQMQPEKGNRSPIIEQIHAIESSLNTEASKNGGNYVFACYVTLDKNDFVICIKSKQYRCIANSILSLHDNLKAKILYSYSVLSLNRQWMQDLAKNESLFPINGAEDEFIDSICLKGITNSVTDGALANKYRELCLQLDKFLFVDWEHDGHDSQLYDILGDYDFRYIARHIPMKRLLLAIAKEDGPLNYESPLFRFALFSSNFVLNIQSGGVSTGISDHYGSAGLSSNPLQNVSEYPSTLEKDTLLDAINKLNEEFASPLCKDIMDILKKYRNELDKELYHSNDFSLRRTTYWANMVSLWKLLSSLSALEKAPTRKYDFHSLYWPYRTLIKMLDDENYYCDPDRQMPDDDLYGFIHGLSSTLHGTLRTDIQFFQINDFNAIVHYAPAKLRAFYSAWTYKLAQCYRQIHVRDSKDRYLEYEFAIVPNTNSVIRTFEFNPCQSTQNTVGTRRLMRIEIPERYLYQPRETCIHLAHETAHFVGTGIRRRSVRHKQFTAILSGMVASQYCTDICNCLVECGRKALAKMFQDFVALEQKKLCNDITTFLEEAVNAVSREDHIADIWENEHIRSRVFISYITTALQMVLDRPVYSIEQFKEGQRSERSKVAYRIRYLCADFRFYARDHWTGNQKELMESLVDFVRIGDDISSSQYSRRFAQFLKQTGPSNILQMPMLLIRETQADITSILTLRITPLQYFQSFFQSGLTYDIRNTKDIGIILKFRLLFVLSALQTASERKDLQFLKEKGWDRPFFNSKSSSDAVTKYDIERVEQAIMTTTEKITPSLCVDTDVLPIRAETSERADIESIRKSTRAYFMLYSEFTARGILSYLNECINAMEPEFHDTETQETDSPREISEIYSRICSKDVLELVEEIDKTLFVYEKKRTQQQFCTKYDP